MLGEVEGWSKVLFLLVIDRFVEICSLVVSLRVEVMQGFKCCRVPRLRHRCTGGGRFLEDWKIKVSVLWLIYALALSVYSTVEILMPGVLADIVDKGEMLGMEITPELLLAMAVLFLVPLVMAFVTFVLKDSVNRWLNIVVGAVFVVLEFLELTDLAANPSAALTLVWIWKTIVPLLIVWYAWKSKRWAQK